MEKENIILRAKGITKNFPGVRALDRVDFDLYPGEVHILVGENGAGKSTLAKVLLGAYQPDEGELAFEGETVRFATTKDALKKGIAAVYQEFTLIPYLNVAQNIFINREYRGKLGLLDHKRMQREAGELLELLGCDYIDTKAPVKGLSVAEQQMAEIAKALSFQPRVIVFDEPTAALSEWEVESLFRQIHKLKAAGIAIVYVSHRMQEFLRIGDRITVMRDGKRIATVGIDECTNEELVNMMVGRDISQVYVRTPNKHGGAALEVNNLADKSGRVKNVSFHVNRGEIVGIAGLVGSGRTEMAQALFGINPIKQAEIKIGGKPVQPRSPVQMVRQGIGLVPEDRKGQGLALKDTIAWNIVSVSLSRRFKKGYIRLDKVERVAEEYRRKLRIVTTGVHKPCRQLSGGNQQKVVLAKWLDCKPEILIFDEPTRGIDVGAKMEIYALMDQLAAEGKAILMISSEMAEVLGMSDRIYVMREGVTCGEYARDEGFNAEQIGANMLGGV